MGVKSAKTVCLVHRYARHAALAERGSANRKPSLVRVRGGQAGESLGKRLQLERRQRGTRVELVQVELRVEFDCIVRDRGIVVLVHTILMASVLCQPKMALCLARPAIYY